MKYQLSLMSNVNNGIATETCETQNVINYMHYKLYA